MSQIAPLLIIVAFWLVMFFLTLWFFRRSMRAPAETEHDGHDAQHGDGGAPVHADDRTPTNVTH